MHMRGFVTKSYANNLCKFDICECFSEDLFLRFINIDEWNPFKCILTTSPTLEVPHIASTSVCLFMLLNNLLEFYAVVIPRVIRIWTSITNW